MIDRIKRLWMSKEKREHPGRPPKRAVRASEKLQIRITPEQVARYKNASGGNLSAWAVNLLDLAAPVSAE